jgi:hypothetical protein
VSPDTNEPNPPLGDKPPWKPVRGPQDSGNFIHTQQPFHGLFPLPSCRRLGGLVGGCQMTDHWWVGPDLLMQLMFWLTITFVAHTWAVVHHGY